MAEIVDRLGAVAFAMNDGRHFKPEQVALVVVIRSAAPGEPAARKAEAGLADRCIEQGAPGAARTARAEAGGDAGHVFVVFPRCV